MGCYELHRVLGEKIERGANVKVSTQRISKCSNDEFIPNTHTIRKKSLRAVESTDTIFCRLGTLQPHRFVQRMNPVRRIYDPNSLPREFDSEVKWPRFISPVQDQGWCGSSWAISTASVASDRSVKTLFWWNDNSAPKLRKRHFKFHVCTLIY